MNPNKLDDTKLDQIAKELGYSYRRGAKPGAGYIVIDAISGETPLGDDYTTPLKAVKEYFDTIAKQLKAKAKALGYSYVQDSEDRDAYVLTEDSTGDTLLVSETLKDISISRQCRQRSRRRGRNHQAAEGRATITEGYCRRLAWPPRREGNQGDGEKRQSRSEADARSTVRSTRSEKPGGIQPELE
jgi:hypothetical protein